MTWTFGNDPAHSNRDAVRILVGDIVEATPLISDEAIDWRLAESGDSIYLAAASCAEIIAGTLSTMIPQFIGETAGSIAKRPEEYRNLARSLRAESLRSNPVSPGYATDFDEEPCFKRGTCYGPGSEDE